MSKGEKKSHSSLSLDFFLTRSNSLTGWCLGMFSRGHIYFLNQAWFSAFLAVILYFGFAVSKDFSKSIPSVLSLLSGIISLNLFVGYFFPITYM